jgi:hypothetical protein
MGARRSVTRMGRSVGSRRGAREPAEHGGSLRVDRYPLVTMIRVHIEVNRPWVERIVVRGGGDHGLF